MNRRMVLFALCLVMRVEAAAMVPPLIIALAQREYAAAYGFVVAMILLLACSLATFLKRPRTKSFYAREGLLMVALGWIIVSVFGALPFFISGYIPNFINAFFESVSGFTTTGATILQDVEALPMSLLFWRSFTHWLGGMGVLVFLLAIVSLAKNTGNAMHVLRAESPGPEVDKLVPRMANSAKILYGIYTGMTVIQIILLLAGGMPLFDSVCAAFGTAGTGGFGILNDSMASYSHYSQNVITIFMVLFGVNFNVYYMLLLRDFRKVWKNQELWVYFAIMASTAAVITFNILPWFDNVVQEAAHHAAFQVASIMTTTGYATVDFNLWPQMSRTLLVIIMFFGACAGSTGGGVKIARIILLGKSFVRDMRRMVRPRSVATVRMNGMVVEENTIRGARSFLTAYLFIALISVVLISLNSFSVETTVTAVVSCMNNVGPGLDAVGPIGNFSMFTELSKLVLSADMLIGRLEIFPMFTLLMPAMWKG